MRRAKLNNTRQVYLTRGEAEDALIDKHIGVKATPGYIVVKSDSAESHCIFCGSDEKTYALKDYAICKACLLEVHETVYNNELDAMKVLHEEIDKKAGVRR